MAITLRPEQEQVLNEAIKSGIAQNADEALDRALEVLRDRLPDKGSPDESVAAAARRLGTFGKRPGLSLDGLTVKELLLESRP